MRNRSAAMNLLQLEAELQEIVKLVGIDALSNEDRMTLEAAQIVREDFLQQNAFSDTDSYTPLAKQARLMQLILRYYELGKGAIANGAALRDVFEMSAREKLGRAKDVSNETFMKDYDEIEALMESEITKLSSKEVQ
jgi:V/A-type H+-transporting ATPase subunit A